MRQAGYTIRERAEETYCAWCGADLLVGDRVTIDECGTPFCGAGCRADYAREFDDKERTAR